MALKKKEFFNHIRMFSFRELFNEMGWNNDRTRQPIVVDEITYTLQAVAEKSGFKIFTCQPTISGTIPDYSIRKKIENKVTKLFQEHLIIFVDSKNQEQIWQLVVRQSGKPAKVTETRYHVSQDPELLFQRASGVFFEMAEEDKITIVDVKKRMNENFHANADRITKAFYDRFKREHTAFLTFIKGIQDRVNQEWYASLMLNRLMFCYFIQKKGFLDNNRNYLRDKLIASQEKKGKDQFYSFYRDFLLVLFHKGLNQASQTAAVKIEIGKIPYLNGGLFDEHELEKMYQSIDIEDKAFERVFDFFDQYEWHLDTRASATGREINPDVIGYIFEKYINYRADMGAYYTKEDITDYISKNCILPYLFEETGRQYPQAMTSESGIWHNLKQSGDQYIYEAVKKGVTLPLPEEIEAGLDTNSPGLLERRKEWNRPALETHALPTEIWREVVDRRGRYADVSAKIEGGDIKTINDFITYNLDIRQFAQDVIENTEDPEFLKHFYKALNHVTIIDPTCGSGAFLFAALNILEPLYEGCIMRMRAFVEDEDRHNEANKQALRNKHKYFRSVLEEIQSEHHPNLKYYIYKSIILRNLYGVDIMKEAVEIAKLRLFLKLVATVEVDYRKPNMGLEPLPDIDFNIRAGNTLVGFATEAELSRSLIEDMEGSIVKDAIEEKCDIVAHAFTRYKDIQLGYSNDYHDFKQAKEELNTRLKALNNELNQLLHKQTADNNYDTWLQSHQPFHWFAEFYEIIHDKGGFDVVIGNPPYVVYSASSFDYKLKEFSTLECKDLYAYVIERSTRIVNKNGSIGMIVPISIVSTDGFSSLRDLLNSQMNNLWYSSYSMRPAKLFEGVDKHLSIFLSNRGSGKALYSTKYYRWNSEYREYLFGFLKYTTIDNSLFHNDSIPKVSTKHETNIIKKLKSNKSISNYIISSSNHKVFHTRKLRYFLQFLETAPKIYETDGSLRITSELKVICFKNDDERLISNSTYLSSLFFWYYIGYSDCRNLNKREVSTFPFALSEVRIHLKNKLIELSERLLIDLQENSYFQEAYYKKYGLLKLQVFQPRISKQIIDKIDTVLAEHYGFTEEELDFIINYDIKYRMGKELENGEEEEN